MTDLDMQAVKTRIQSWGQELGFQQVAVCDVDLTAYAADYQQWLAKQFHGDMQYMAENQDLRCHPEKLHPGTQRVICVRMDYAESTENSLDPLQRSQQAYVARYARGRDYHKLMRKRLQQLAEKIQAQVGEHGYRAFVDSAPVLERALAEKSGLGWIGKNTMLINKKAGSWFFLGELFTDMPIPVDEPSEPHCGSCQACLDICPTNAFAGANQLDARRCISYLTIELRSSIPEEFRKPMGNRVFGCDDCNLICPWNKFTHRTMEKDFSPRHQLDEAELIELFAWTESEFLERTQGSAIRRIGYECWLRNLAIGLGNASTNNAVISALRSAEDHPSAMVREHVEWALRQHQV